jgi:hypothetical protein
VCHVYRQYAAIVFIANNRFETGKKKLSHLTFEDFVFCANQMITNWSYSSAGKEKMYFKCCIYRITTYSSPVRRKWTSSVVNIELLPIAQQ